VQKRKEKRGNSFLIALTEKSFEGQSLWVLGAERVALGYVHGNRREGSQTLWMELLEGEAEIFQTSSKEGEKKGEHTQYMPKGRELKRGAGTASKGRLCSWHFQRCLRVRDA
jgi:hypothetical protein